MTLRKLTILFKFKKNVKNTSKEILLYLSFVVKNHVGLFYFFLLRSILLI